MAYDKFQILIKTLRNKSKQLKDEKNHLPKNQTAFKNSRNIKNFSSQKPCIIYQRGNIRK